MGKIKITSKFLVDFKQVQLRTYDSKGKYLEPIKNWYLIGDEWGLKIKRGQFRMKKQDGFVKFLNQKLDDMDAKKIAYELMFFNGTHYYEDIHNVDFNTSKIIPRKIDGLID